MDADIDDDMDDMEEITEATLVEVYMADTTDDVGAVAFINSEQCTKEMVNYVDDDGWCALNLAARLNRHEVVKALIDKEVNVNQVSWDSSYNALMYCIVEGNYYNDEHKANKLATIDLLIRAHTNLNYVDRFSAFTLACELNQTPVIQRLLQEPIDIHLKDENDKTGMDYLKENNNEEALALVEKYILHGVLQNNLAPAEPSQKKPKI